jgi:cobaltochelatase CobN
MHLLATRTGNLGEGGEAVDLGQEPADIVFLSAADTELAAVAQAWRNLGAGAPSLRLANLGRLAHPMSVDLYARKTLAGSALAVARVLGGENYFRYGLEAFAATARSHGVAFLPLPGDDKRDGSLDAYLHQAGRAGPGEARLLHAYLSEGGPGNVEAFIRRCAFLLGRGEAPPPATPLLHAGTWAPGRGICDPAELASSWKAGQPVAAICFYRALVQSASVEPVETLAHALRERGVNPLPVFVTSLKDDVSVATLRAIFARHPIDLAINLTGFAASRAGASGEGGGTVLDETGAVTLQAALGSTDRATWSASAQGMSARDLAMHVALPEFDGRVLTRTIAFKEAGERDALLQADLVRHVADPDRVAFVADLAANWIALRRTPVGERRIALVLANYPNRDGRLANGVGLDTPASVAVIGQAMAKAGYDAAAIPANGADLLHQLQAGPTNSGWRDRQVAETISLKDYKGFVSSLAVENQIQLRERWGEPEGDPMFDRERQAFVLPARRYGRVAVAIQPARGYNIDPKATYHAPDLVPPHNYLAFHLWLRKSLRAHAVVHVGKHGNLEWLPGKALALSRSCWPEVALGPTPNLYPFIVNDPGEGAQAKRRTSAVVVDHLTPPLTRGELHGSLAELEGLVDECAAAAGQDARREKELTRQILALAESAGLDRDAGVRDGDGEAGRLARIDAFLCDLKEMQIRDGLHVFGRSPAGRQLAELAVALLRVPRGGDNGKDASLHRAIAADSGLGAFDPLDCEFARSWDGPRPGLLQGASADPWRTHGDTVERIERAAVRLVAGELECPPAWSRTRIVLEECRDRMLPAIAACGDAEIRGLLGGLDGRFVPPGPSGAPSRGRPDVLPTGRNFYSLDCRSLPTPAAFEIGRKSAELLVARYRQDHGDWPTAFGLSVWGTANMRTGGDDIAQALALIGVRPVWEPASRRVTGYEILPVAALGRPRIDVTLRISGMFRDAFPLQIELFDKAARAVGALEEPPADNPVAARMAAEREALGRQGMPAREAAMAAGARIYGSKPGAYGAGLQAFIDGGDWDAAGDLAEGYLSWGGYAYGAEGDVRADRAGFERRLASLEAVVHNQDNREHDLLDSDDYYQFEGGMAAAVRHLTGARPAIYHNDHSRPGRPVIRALEEEIARVVRGRAANPKWIAGVMRHGYKGAFEIAATLDYLFAFAATTGAVRNAHFDLVYDAWIGDAHVRDFIATHNPAALREMAQRFLEAARRGLWTGRSNSAKFELELLAKGGMA